MAAASRTSQFAHVHKVLGKHYRPCSPDPQRSVLEHLLYACVLEESPYDAAEEAFAALVHTFFDWNEVRVTSVAELAEVMSRLPEPRGAARRLKAVLHGIFESQFSFDLEDIRKKNLGPAVKWLEKLDGTNGFTVGYVVQAALGGHRIPIDRATLKTLLIVDLITEKDAEKGEVPGLERAVAKSKGVEFGSLLHQLGADFAANPYSPKVRKILLELNPECKDRLPKRRTGKKAAENKSAAERQARRDKKEAGEKAKSKKRTGSKKPDGENVGTTGAAASKKKSPAKKSTKRKPR